MQRITSCRYFEYIERICIESSFQFWSTREVEQESTPRIIPHSPLDFVQNLVDKTDIDEILPYEAYYAAHSMRKDLLITPITIPYGNKARQNLDIYSPPNLENNSMPTLVFLYGGGLIHGSKSSNEVGSVFWNNVGTYFAMRGYVTVRLFSSWESVLLITVNLGNPWLQISQYEFGRG